MRTAVDRAIDWGRLKDGYKQIVDDYLKHLPYFTGPAGEYRADKLRMHLESLTHGDASNQKLIVLIFALLNSSSGYLKSCLLNKMIAYNAVDLNFKARFCTQGYMDQAIQEIKHTQSLALKLMPFNLTRDDIIKFILQEEYDKLKTANTPSLASAVKNMSSEIEMGFFAQFSHRKTVQRHAIEGTDVVDVSQLRSP